MPPIRQAGALPASSLAEAAAEAGLQKANAHSVLQGTWPRLKEMDVLYTAVGRRGLDAVVAAAPALQRLHISPSRLVDADATASAVVRCHALRQLSVRGWKDLSQLNVYVFKGRCARRKQRGEGRGSDHTRLPS